jgi:tetratricopeptide (TPR) repeat protein
MGIAKGRRAESRVVRGRTCSGNKPEPRQRPCSAWHRFDLFWPGEEGLTSIQKYLRLDPRDTRTAVFSLQTAVGHYFCREYDVAAEAAERIIRLYPGFPLSYRWLPAALGQLGHTEEAKEALEKGVAIAPASFDMYVRRRVPGSARKTTPTWSKVSRKAGWQV